MADSLKLDILALARTGNKLLAVSGRPEWMCQAVEVADPVTFTTPDTVLVSHVICDQQGPDLYAFIGFILSAFRMALHSFITL